jgi:hypothetical protein
MATIWEIWVRRRASHRNNQGLTISRLDTCLRHRYRGLGVPLVAVRSEASSGRTKVCLISPATSLVSAHSCCREMQLFLVGYIIIEICEIFTVGKFPLNSKVVIVSSIPLGSPNRNRADRYRHSLASTSA